jgi:hypothetical protein
MVTSRTVRINPRTNDIYFNKQGRMELASKEEALAQKFSVLVNTKVGQCPLHYEYGLDYDYIKNSGFMKTEQAFFMELTRKFEEGVEPNLYGFNVLSAYDNPLAKTITFQVQVTGKDRTTATAEVSIS